MELNDQLFVGKKVRLSSIDHEKDAEIEARWTQDASFLRLLSANPPRPVSAEKVKKRYEGYEKDMDEHRNVVHFPIRLVGDESNRMIGFARLQWIEWGNRNAWISIGIGDPADRGCGYGREALALILRYAFMELGLRRISAVIPGDNDGALRFFQKAGFVEEIRRRKALFRDGVRWDMVHMGLLYEEWEAKANEGQPNQMAE